MLPTLATLGGGSAPTGIDGLDFSPTLAGEDQPELADRFLYWEFGKFGVYSQAARWNQWKTVRDLKKKTLELYDLSTDISESHDVAAEHPDVVAKFKTYYQTARAHSALWPVKAKVNREKTAAAGHKSTAAAGR